MSKLHSIFRPLILSLFRRFYFSRTQNPTASRIASPNYVHFVSVAFFSWFVASNSQQYPNHFDAEKQISALIQQAEESILQEKFSDAKKILNKALKLADDNQAYGSLSYMCDLLSSIVLSEGDLLEAENILVKFIEKLLQLGYPEDHNSIVKFKLKLARLYQLLGSQEMAEYGFRDCISKQEGKMSNSKQLDEESNGIYLTALFWYGKLLVDQKEYARARKEYKLCLERIGKATNVLPSQKMVVLHNLAGVSAVLKDYDGALNYLFDAIETCLLEDPGNPDLPIYVVQVGLLYLQKGVYEGASFWCQAGMSIATHEKNQLAETQGQKCLDELKKLKIIE